MENPDSDISFEWSLVFLIGGWEPTSVLIMDGRNVDLIIDSRLTLIRPTAEEIRRIAGVKQDAAP